MMTTFNRVYLQGRWMWEALDAASNAVASGWASTPEEAEREYQSWQEKAPKAPIFPDIEPLWITAPILSLEEIERRCNKAPMEDWIPPHERLVNIIRRAFPEEHALEIYGAMTEEMPELERSRFIDGPFDFSNSTYYSDLFLVDIRLVHDAQDEAYVRNRLCSWARKMTRDVLRPLLKRDGVIRMTGGPSYASCGLDPTNGVAYRYHVRWVLSITRHQTGGE